MKTPMKLKLEDFGSKTDFVNAEGEVVGTYIQTTGGHAYYAGNCTDGVEPQTPKPMISTKEIPI